MGRGQTTDEFRDRFVRDHPATARLWAYYGGNPGDPGWVSEAARKFGDQYGLDAEALDGAAEDDGWEFHDTGYDAKVEECARTADERGIPKAGPDRSAPA